MAIKKRIVKLSERVNPSHEMSRRNPNTNFPNQDPDKGRYLAAVVFIDVVGFTSLVQENEQETLGKLEQTKELLEALHQKHQGRIIQYYGDGSLSVFKSAYHALLCSLEIQKEARHQNLLPLRIGVHLGDIVEKGAAIYGDGVNVASRIESVAIKNSILVSEDIYRHAHNHPDFKFKELGTVKFKNVEHAIRLFALDQENLAIPSRKQLHSKLSEYIKSPRKKTNVLIWVIVAILAASTIYTNWNSQRTIKMLSGEQPTSLGVLPFEMVSADNSTPVPEVLLNSLTNEVSDQLGSLYGLKVVSPEAIHGIRRSKKVNWKEAGEMGLTHVLEGKMKQRDDTFSLHLDLIDTRTKKKVWSQQYDKPIQDVFRFQKEISKDILPALAVEDNPFREKEIRPDHFHFEVKSLYHEARQMRRNPTPVNILKSITLLEKCISIDSTFALGYASLSLSYAMLKGFQGIDEKEIIEKASEYVGIALFYKRDLAEAYLAQALLNYNFGLSESQEVIELCQQAINLRPSYDYPYYLMGKTFFDQQNYVMAKQCFEYALELNPQGPDYKIMLSKSIETIG